MEDYISILSGLLGILIGGGFQFLLNRRAKRLEEFDKLRSEAYVDFLRGAARIAMAQRFDDKQAELVASSLMLEGKIRIAVYGSEAVLRGVGDFFEKYGDFSDPAHCRAFVDLMLKMREDVIGDSGKDAWAALSKILFSQGYGA